MSSSVDARDCRGTQCVALMDFRVAPPAESDLDEIWYFLATQSSNIGIADRVIDSITARFAAPRSR
jgi:hypothetical protein